MNALEALLDKPFIQALGWALIHFVWQGALVAALYASARVVLRRASSNARYGAACAAMLLMLVLPVATAVVAYSPSVGPGGYGPSAAAESSPSLEAGTVVDLSGALWQHPAYTSSRERAAPAPSGSLRRLAERGFGPVLPWLVALWLAGVLFMSVRFMGGLVLVQRLKRVGVVPAAEVWQERFASLREQLRVSRPVRLCESALVEVPTVIGWLRPVILVPASVFTGISPPQLEALLAHELAHIRRYDYLVNLIQTAVETLLFYHPAVWWVSSQARQEREHCCDDLAVEVCNDVLVYARALAALEHLRSHMPQPAVAATGGSLLKRIQRLVGSPSSLSQRSDSWLAGLIAVAAAFSILAGSQAALISTAATSAEVASEVYTSSATAQKDAGRAARLAPPDKARAVASGDAQTSEESEVASIDSPPAQEESGAADQDRDSGGQDFIALVAAEGYTDLTVEQLIALKTNGVTPEFIRGMKTSFDHKIPVEHLVALRFQGVTPEFVREMKEAGLDKISAEQAIAFKVHGVSPQFVREMKALGYDGLSADTFIAFSVHGVTAAMAREVMSLGFDRPDEDDLVALRVHGATPQFIRAIRSYFQGGLSLEDVTAMRIHGVTPEYLRELEALGYRDLPADKVTAFRVHGVTVQFIKSLQSLGYNNVEADHLTALRAYGVTPEFIRKVKDRGFTDVTIEQLIELKRLNIIPSSDRD